MGSKKKLIYLTIVVVIAMGVYFYIQGKKVCPQVPPRTITEEPPVVEQSVPSKGKDVQPAKIEKQPVLPTPSSAREKIELSPAVNATPHDTVNLEEQSYSIHKEKKEIPITPGVILQPGKSVNLKVGEDVIKLERDKTYHPGAYNVLWEKKY